MANEIITTIKKTDGHLRNHLSRLACYAYQTYQKNFEPPQQLQLKTEAKFKYKAYLPTFNPQKPYLAYEEEFKKSFGEKAEAVFNALKAAHSLNLNVRQAQKYNQYLFNFDASKNYDYYKEIFKKTFSQAEDPEQIFNMLKAEHPYGVEIWVYPEKEKSASPLIEHINTEAANSILSAARMMLADQQEKKLQEISSANIENVELEKVKEELNKKYLSALEKLEKEHQSATKKINSLYKKSFELTDPESEYKVAKLAVDVFQKMACAQVTSFSNNRPAEADYTKVYKQLALYEQRTKFRGFYETSANQQNLPDLEGDTFNQDIFSLDIKDEDEDHSIIKADIHYYDRKYNLTPQQVRIKKIVDGSKENSVPYQPQATATSHSPDYLLANSALTEEGTYQIKDNKPETIINTFIARHGSPSPNEYYQKNVAKINGVKGAIFSEHESTYYAFLNMQQHIQNLRAKAIKAILLNAIVTSNKPNEPLNSIKKQMAFIACGISYELTKLLNDQNFDPDKSKSNKELIEKAIANAVNNNSENISETHIKAIKEQLLAEANTNNIINIKTIHTHLITATGPGSLSQYQREQFLDSRIAQYATWHNEAGYVYMSNGVNSVRGLGRFFLNQSNHLEGNNSVALVELAGRLSQSATLAKINIKNQKAYNDHLAKTKQASKQYMHYVENNYCGVKLDYDHTCKEIATHETALKQLNKKAQKKEYQLLREKIKQLKKQQSAKKKSLKVHDKKLNKLRAAFEKEEKALHEEAKRSFNEIYSQLNNDNFDVELDNNYHKISAEDYLSRKALQLASNLFANASWYKKDQYNGVMQALINLAAEQMQVFSSYGCKSNNDRALLLAMIITKLSSEIIQDPARLAQPDYLEKLVSEAQEAYAWHISRHHTAKDRSAAPKTGKDILADAAKFLEEYTAANSNTTLKITSLFNQHKKLSKAAADKRKRNSKTLDKETMDRFAIQQNAYAYIYQYWTAPERKNQLPEAVADKLFALAACSDEEPKKKLAAIQETRATFNNIKLDENLQMLDMHLEHAEFKLLVQQPPAAEDGPHALQTFFVGLKKIIEEKSKDKKYHGEGWKRILEILAKVEPEKADLNSLVKAYFDLRIIAHPRLNDATQYLASRTKLFGLQERRPLWLQEIYKLLQTEVKEISVERLNSAMQQAVIGQGIPRENADEGINHKHEARSNISKAN